MKKRRTHMKTFRPELFNCMKSYTKKQLASDIVAGIIVAIIALPLSIALALASGVNPEQGLYTAIVAGAVIAFMGGSRVQISGPTAAFASIVAGIVAKNGMQGLAAATIMAGLFLIIMGVLRCGSLIKFIPYTITTGFTAGIAVTIIIGQMKDFFGLTFQNSPVETLEKLKEVITTFGTINISAMLIGLLSLAILILWPMLPSFFKKIPPSLIAVVTAAAVVKIFGLNVNTIGDLYEISSKPPMPVIPSFSFETIRTVIPDAFTIAVLAAVESLLSCVVADGMTGTKHNSNTELIAQGAGNICSALFGGIPATGAIARTAANIKNGGRTPIAGIVHAIVLLLILVIFMPYAALIPMPAIAAVLFIVAYNMSEWRTFADLIKTSPKSDITVLVVTFLLTVMFDLVIAICAGLILAAVLFMKRMSDVTDVHDWTYIDDPSEDVDNIGLKIVPKHTLVYELTGPMFFGVADKFARIMSDKSKDVIILRMRSVPAIDATALRSLNNVLKMCKKYKITLILSHVNEQPMSVMKKSGFDLEVGHENICANIDDALARAESIESPVKK